MRRYLSAAAAIVVLCSGCYHVTVITGAPASPTVIDKPWQNSFVYGIVPPPELNTKDQCTQGVAKVETERSFVNGLVSVLTWSIYTPIHAMVTCASGPVPR
jgi:hypothetical protein